MIVLNNDEQFTKNEIVAFNNQYLQAFQKLSEITKQKKQLEEDENSAKKILEKVMDEHNIKSIDNQFMKITRVNGSTSTSVDLKELEKKEPELYKELLEDYPKTTTKKAYLTFSVK